MSKDGYINDRNCFNQNFESLMILEKHITAKLKKISRLRGTGF